MKEFKQGQIKLYKGDCLEEYKNIPENSVDLILTDLPYGTIKGMKMKSWEDGNEWDVIIDTKEIFKIQEIILKQNKKSLLFAQQPFTTELINNATYTMEHSYNMIWNKEHYGNALSSKKAPVNLYEDIVVFNKKYDINNNNPLRKYFNSILDYIECIYEIGLKEITDKIGRRAEHCFYINSTQFSIPTKETYEELTKEYNLQRMKNYLNYDNITKMNDFPIFNLPKGENIKSNIFSYKKESKRYHPTQKPILLLEDLIKTYSNEGDLVVDLTMGSGSTGIACYNTNRRFIGIEMDDKFFDIAVKRFEEREGMLV